VWLSFALKGGSSTAGVLIKIFQPENFFILHLKEKNLIHKVRGAGHVPGRADAEVLPTFCFKYCVESAT
jgi:hypothetical protein